jgi:ankyrin repeat protein
LIDKLNAQGLKSYRLDLKPISMSSLSLVKTEESKLQYAAFNGEYKKIKKLFKKKPEVYKVCITKPLRDITALMCAAQNGHLDIVKFLVDQGAETNLENGHYIGFTALDYASLSGNPKISELLVKAGGLSLNQLLLQEWRKKECYAEYKKMGDSELIVAIKCGYADIIEILLTLNCDINLRDLNGNTALMETLRTHPYNSAFTTMRKKDMIKTYVDPIFVNEMRRDRWAEAQSRIKYYEWHDLYVETQIETVIDWLLKAGADPYIKNNEGKTIFDFASSLGNDGTKAILSKYEKK